MSLGTRLDMETDRPKYVVYVLPLEQSRFYVGQTKERNFEERMKQHRDGRGAAFTSRFRPIIGQAWIDSHHSDEQTACFTEMTTTLQLMEKYGIRFVRGAQWCAVEIDAATKAEIQKQLDQINNRCFVCHQPGHAATRCPNAAATAAAVPAPVPVPAATAGGHILFDT